jgi:hypothetical protein
LETLAARYPTVHGNCAAAIQVRLMGTGLKTKNKWLM